MRRLDHLLYEPEAEALRLALNRIFEHPSTTAEEFFAEIAKDSDPKTLLRVALEEFSTKGNQDRLQICASSLVGMGRRAESTLREIAASDFEEQSAFVDAIALADFFDSSERLELMRTLAMSATEETRRRVLDVIDCLPPESQLAILGILARDPLADLSEQAQAHTELLRRSPTT